MRQHAEIGKTVASAGSEYLLLNVSQRPHPCSFLGESIMDPSMRLIASCQLKRNRLFLRSFFVSRNDIKQKIPCTAQFLRTHYL